MFVDEQFDEVGVTTLRGEVNRRDAGLRLGVDERTMLEQQVGNLFMSVFRRQVQRRLAVLNIKDTTNNSHHVTLVLSSACLVEDIDSRVMLQKDLQNVDVTLFTRHEKRRPTVLQRKRKIKNLPNAYCTLPLKELSYA